MSANAVTLRLYQAADEEASIELWRRTWQAAYPNLDFRQRVDWWRERWRNELVTQATIMVAENSGELCGYVTVDPRNGYLDQIVVAPELWSSAVGAALIDEAKRISPSRLELLVNKDNVRAIQFYRKHGFVRTGDDVNPISGKPVDRMSWRA